MYDILEKKIERTVENEVSEFNLNKNEQLTEMLLNNFVITHKSALYLITAILLRLLAILRVVTRFRSHNADLCVKYQLHEQCNIARAK